MQGLNFDFDQNICASCQICSFIDDTTNDEGVFHLKRRWSILLSAALIALVTVGCGNQNNNDNNTVSSDVSAVSAASVSEPVSHTEESPQDSSETVSQETHAESSVQKDTESSAPTILESNTQQQSVIEFSLDHDRPFDTIEEYLQTDSAKEMIRQLNEAETSGSEVIRTAVFAESGTKLIFERQLSTDFNLWLTDEFLENVQKNVEAQKTVFVSLVDGLESCINSKVITVVVRYVDPEGNVLYQREFDNDHLDTGKTSAAESSQVSGQTSGQVSGQTSAAQTSRTVSQSSQAVSAVSAVSHA